MKTENGPPETANVLLQMISLHAIHSGAWDGRRVTAESIREKIREVSQDDERLGQFDVEVVEIHDEICVQLVEKSAVDQLALLVEVEPDAE